MSLNILIRCDASSTIGIGHVMRDLVLADTLVNKGFSVHFACINLEGNLISKIECSGFQVFTLNSHSATELVQLLQTSTYDWLVLDHYGIDINFEKNIKKELDIRVLSFDDTYNKHYCDILLNHGFQAKATTYQSLVDSNTKVLCGQKYTLVHHSFLKKHIPSKKVKTIKSILITIGGSDNKSFSLTLVRLLKKINPKLKVTLVTTTVNPKLLNLKNKRPVYGYKLLINSNNMAELMKKHDLVITASGGTLFEVFALNKVFINLSVASNQDEITDYLKKHHFNTGLKKLNYQTLKQKLLYLQKNQASLLQKMTKIQFTNNKIAKEMRDFS